MTRPAALKWPVVLCVDCLQSKPVDTITERVIFQLSAAFTSNEIAADLIGPALYACECGGQCCICAECAAVAEGRSYDRKEIEPCPTLARRGLSRVRRPLQ